jgi:hypothetical protein
MLPQILRAPFLRAGSIAFGLTAAVGCTQTVPSQFKLLQANDAAQAATDVSETKVEKFTVPVDILWVIDNSASMLTSQTKLKNGLSAFARDYLTKPGTDIQLAVITTDTFVANPAWNDFLNTPNPTTKKTPLQIHASKSGGARQWGPEYAKLKSSELMQTKRLGSGLVSKFKSLVSVGTAGIYEEHGFDSVEQFIADNELGSSPNKLFRKNSQRIIVFLSDENDQSLGENVIPDPRKLLYSGSYYTGKNTASADAILPPQFTISCGPGEEYVKGAEITASTAMTLCLRPNLAEPVAKFKARLDRFFQNLDGVPGGNPNYFVTAIVGQDPATIVSLRKNTTEKNAETGLTVITNEIGTRYLELVSQTGNGSFAMDIGANDYTPILDKVGLEIEKRSVQTKKLPQTTIALERQPDLSEPFFVTLVRDGGARSNLEKSQYSVSGKIVKITDQAMIDSLQPGDLFYVVSQPNEQVPAEKRRN